MFLDLEDYEREARECREALGIVDQTQPDMITVILKLKHLGLIGDYERVPDDQLPDDEALWDPDKRLLRLRESIFCGANQLNPGSRPRFTIAHELGHIWRGHKKTRHRNVSARKIEKIAPTIKRDEREANGFAAAFLSPTHLVPNPLQVTVDALVSRFNISRAAAERRKPELERMYRRKHDIARPLPPSITDYLRDRKK